MTRNDFLAVCSEYTIDPAVALEEETIIYALREGADVEELKQILQELF